MLMAEVANIPLLLIRLPQCFPATHKAVLMTLPLIARALSRTATSRNLPYPHSSLHTARMAIGMVDPSRLMNLLGFRVHPRASMRDLLIIGHLIIRGCSQLQHLA